MRKTIILAALILAAGTMSAQSPALVMKYDKPAGDFNEALPLGNGQLGAMFYGRTTNEVIHLNESTLWGGHGTDNNPTPDGPAQLAKARAALMAENWEEGRLLTMPLQGNNVNAYLPMGDLHIRQNFVAQKSQIVDYSGNNVDRGGSLINLPISEYSRSLDLNTATGKTSFKAGNTLYTREMFVSHADKALVIKLSSSSRNGLNLTIDAETPWEGACVQSVSSDEICVSGHVGYYVKGNWRDPYSQYHYGPNGETGMRYSYRVKVVQCNGLVYSGTGIHIAGASEAVILVTAATSYNGWDKNPQTEGKDEAAICAQRMAAASAKKLDELRDAHVADYRSIFDRVELDIDGSLACDTDKTVSDRLVAYAGGAEDKALEMLYFQFGRYLLISSSREDSEVPINLQGIWNKDRRPVWGCDYHTNINLQMNYWPAEPLGMSESFSPLVPFMEGCAANGAEVVRNMYGMRGWTMHQSSDIWCLANPVGEKQGDPSWANFVMGGGWMAQHLYEHYRFTRDKEYLENSAYPIMKGAAEFLMDWLVEKDGKYVTLPSTSPENSFYDDNHVKGRVTIGSAMDLEICWDVFTNCIEASEALGTDPELRAKWQHYRDNLLPLQIGRKGNLVEWYKDWDDVDPQHRHVSHLFALYPGREISPMTTPELAAAARKTLETRGDGGTGWSKAWKICFWARLLDGDHAYKMYRELLSKSTLNSLLDTHPPFQIDGNLGSISGIAEMLLQSQNDVLHLLPALPSSWKDGSVKGICGRGAFTVDMTWHDGKLSEARILSNAGGKCIARADAPLKVRCAGRNVKVRSYRDGGCWMNEFVSVAGKSYELSAVRK